MSDTAHAGPQPKTYWIIALVLAALTAVEITIPSVDALDPITLPALLGLGAIKFMIVVGFFMHLKFDKPLYRNLFFIGVLGAIIIFMVVLAVMQGL
jgi:cytochrome c oxidase subunit IV